MVSTITILGGKGKDGSPEPVKKLDLRMGDIVSVVGPTGSGKTTLINDLELFAQGDTPTGRRILVDGAPPPPDYRNDPAFNPIALITQHTNFLSDLPVREFLLTHAAIRNGERQWVADVLDRTLAFANELTGEPIITKARMTELSGGQTRALLIADATIICNTPIVLLDEVENAGINRTRALELLKDYRKIFIFVTHDPRIALLSDVRVVMANGRMVRVQVTDDREREIGRRVGKVDDILARLRDDLRAGREINAAHWEVLPA